MATTPPEPQPASHCPQAAHTLQWGLHPDSSTQGWILRNNGSVVAALDGYPPGRPPVPAPEAREWADQILGARQTWVEQPARSGAFHAHRGHPMTTPPAPPVSKPTRVPDEIATEINECSDTGIPADWPKYEDRDGDTWFLTGQTHDGDRVMLPSPCDVPLMLRRDAERLYGPLTAVSRPV